MKWNFYFSVFIVFSTVAFSKPVWEQIQKVEAFPSPVCQTAKGTWVMAETYSENQWKVSVRLRYSTVSGSWSNVPIKIPQPASVYRYTINSIIPTNTGGLALGGFADSAGYRLGLFLVTDSLGKILSHVHFHSSSIPLDNIDQVIQNTDGSFVMVSNSYARDRFRYEGVIFKTDFQGKIIWERNLNFPNGESQRVSGGQSIKPTTDGGYILATDIFYTYNRYFGGLLKLDSLGEVQWHKLHQDLSYAQDVIVTKSGGYLVSGYQAGYQGYDAVFIEVDSNANYIWKKVIGAKNSYSDLIYGISPLNDGYLTAIHTRDSNWLAKMDMDGNFLWGENYFGTPIFSNSPFIGNDRVGICFDYLSKQSCGMVSETP